MGLNIQITAVYYHRRTEHSTDTGITISVATSHLTNLPPALRARLAIPILPSITSKPRPNTAGAGPWPRTPALPLRGQQPLLKPLPSSPSSRLSRIHRLSIPHHESELAYLPLGKLASVQRRQCLRHNGCASGSRVCSDILRRVQTTQRFERFICVHELHMWDMSGMCTGIGRWAGERADELVPEV